MNRHALMIGLSVMSVAAATAVGGCSRRDQNQTPTTATDPAASGSATTDSTGASSGQTPTAPDMTTPGNVDASGTSAETMGSAGSTTGATGSSGGTGSNGTQDRSTGATPGATTSGSSSTATSGGPPR